MIQFGRFISLFRVLVHAKLFSFRTAKPSGHKRSKEPNPFTRRLHPFDSRSRYPAVNGLYVHKPLCLSLHRAYPLRLSVCPLSNGISKLIQPLELTLYYPFIPLQVEKDNKKDICNHNNHSVIDKNRKGYQFKRKLSIHSTIWPISPLYHFVNRNGRRFDSVGCFYLFSSSYNRSYVHLSKS